MSCSVRMWHKFIPLCHNGRVWQTDGRMDRQTERNWERPWQYHVLRYMQSHGKKTLSNTPWTAAGTCWSDRPPRRALFTNVAPAAPYKRRQQTVSTCVDCSIVHCLVQTFIVLCWLVSIATDARHKWLTNSERSILAEAAVADTQAMCRCINAALRLAAAAAAVRLPGTNELFDDEYMNCMENWECIERTKIRR